MNGGVLVGFNESLVAAAEFIESCPFGAMFIGACALLASILGAFVGRSLALFWLEFVRSKLNQ